jgi:hypothetical protein
MPTKRTMRSFIRKCVGAQEVPMVTRACMFVFFALFVACTLVSARSGSEYATLVGTLLGSQDRRSDRGKIL